MANFFEVIIKILIILPWMVHLFIYGVRDAMATNRSCPALLELRFSFSAFIADFPSFHTFGSPIFLFPFC